MRRSTRGYEVLVTTDQNLRYQQNLAGLQVGLVALLSTKWPEVHLRTRDIGQAIAAARPGDVVEVPIRAE